MTTTHTTACPDPEVVGAFVEGRLGASERKKMMEHLDRCEACRDEVAVLSDFAAAPIPERATPSRWWLAVAASLVTIVGAALVWQVVTSHRSRSPLDSLVAASSRLEYRTVEARLSGFGWAEFRGAVRSSTEGSSNPRQLKLAGAAGTVLEEAAADSSADVQHAAALASLLLNDPRPAIERLTKLTSEHPDDARAWSDLAAAYHASAVRSGTPGDEPRALAAVDRALKIDPKLPEALFNRALIVQQIGLSGEARDAWTQYLEVDSSSEWAREARRRRDAISTTTDRSLFTDQRQRLEQSAAAGDTRAVAAFVARFPEESRRIAEKETLGSWGTAFANGDMAEAARQLTIARTIGNALRAQSGEELLTGIVAAINNANATQRTHIAEAYVLHRAAYANLDRGENAAARDKFLQAAKLLAGTPGALNARYLAANRARDMEHAIAELRELSSDIDGHSGYKALRAQIAGAQGLAEAKLVHWSDALEHYQVARTLFGELGERSNAAFVSVLIGESFSFLGRRDDAWKAWSEALRTLSKTGPERTIFATINATAQSEIIAGNSAAAMSLLDIELRHSKSLRPDVRAEVLFRRAILSARAGDSEGAVKFIAEGQRAAREIEEESARENAIADLDVAEGIAFASSEPQRALISLTRAVGVREESRRMLLPATLFERARVLRSLGRSGDARSDLESAVDAIEGQRKPVEWRDTKSGALDGIDQIYITLAELLLERGDDRGAFAVADRAAAHAFYGARATGSVTSIDALQQRLAPGAMVVEYLVLPRQIVLFFVDAGTFETRRAAVGSADVARMFGELDQALRERAPVVRVQDASAHLHKILIAPLRDLLARGSSITFVPDPLIASLPFAVLFDPASNHWLIEDHSIRITPSALYKDDTRGDRATRVVVIRPSAGDVDLPKTAGEVAAIAQLYPHAYLVEGSSLSAASILDSFRDADVIHYAGHANNESEAGLVLRIDNGRPEILYAADVAGATLRGAPLVVLAGCRTLRGGARREDLATSLARAFLLAGARAVVGTTWDVDDEAAATLFTRFHRLNAASADPAGALTDAQRSVLHEGRHPADWAFPQIVVRAIDI